MPIFGASIAIIKDGKVLLQLREDARLWNLPGGAIEDGESLAQAAIREAREETGLEVRLTRLVGVYSRPKWRMGGGHDVLFAAEPNGGDLRNADPHETVEVRFFAPDDLPHDLIWWHRRHIQDAFSGAGNGLAWSQEVVWPFAPDLDRGVLRARAQADPALAQRLLRTFLVPPSDDPYHLEVGGPGEAPRGVRPRL
jgi:ADP-ribose pyrophosphatase YjhB (NUDIX family)